MSQIYHIKEEYFDIIEKYQHNHPYTTNYYKSNGFKGPWVILATQGEEIVVMRIPGSSQSGQALFGIKREYLLSVSEFRDMKIDLLI